MANEKVTELPTVVNALASDIIYAVQAGDSVQETLQQVLELSNSYIVLTNAGNPNGTLAGIILQLCFDTTNNKLYICSATGSAVTATWVLLGAAVVDPIQGGTGVSNPTIHTLPVAQGSSDFNFLGPLDNGELLIGSTGADPVATTITAGTNISIANGAGTITISGSGAAGFSWNSVGSTPQSMTANNGYITVNAGTVAYTLPATAAFGTELVVVGKGAGGWTIAQNAGQSIVLGSSTSTVGAGGSVASTNAKDCLIMICTVANTEWTAISWVGTLTIV